MAKDNVDVVQNSWDAFARGDLDGAVEAIAASAETRVPQSVPWGGTYVGPDGFRDFIYKLDQAFEQSTLVGFGACSLGAAGPAGLGIRHAGCVGSGRTARITDHLDTPNPLKQSLPPSSGRPDSSNRP